MGQRGEAAQQQQAGHAEGQGQRRTPKRGGDERGAQAVAARLEEGLAGSGEAALLGEGIEGEDGQAGHGQRHAGGVEEERHDAPRQAGRQCQVEADVDRRGAEHQAIA